MLTEQIRTVIAQKLNSNLRTTKRRGNYFFRFWRFLECSKLIAALKRIF